MDNGSSGILKQPLVKKMYEFFIFYLPVDVFSIYASNCTKHVMLQVTTRAAILTII